MMTSAKMATSGLLEVKAFWKKGYHVIIPLHDVINKVLTHESSHNVNVAM